MGNDFFDNHPMLGSVFDFNRNGSLNLGETGAMAAMGSMAVTELMRATEESERDAARSPQYAPRIRVCLKTGVFEEWSQKRPPDLADDLVFRGGMYET